MQITSSDTDALIRREFAALETPYLDVAARGPLPASAEAAAIAAVQAQARGKVPKAQWLALGDTVRRQLAKLIGAEAEEIAFTKNASEGLNIVASGLGFRRGEQIVVAPAAEHPNNVFPWLWQAQQNNADLIQVTVEQGEQLEPALIRHITNATRLVAVTAVDFGTGRRTDLAAIGAACRRVGAFLLVDAAQSSGVLAEDMDQLHVDGWATAVQKGLLGPYGLGVLYVRRSWTERIRPMQLARFSVELAAGHEAAGPEDGWRLRDGAGRYEVGNYNYIGLAALQASVDLLLRIGAAEVERRSLTAAQDLRSALERLDIPTLQVPQENRSHIVSVAHRQQEGHDRSDVPWINALSQHLTADGIAHSVRRGAVRLATHVHVLPEVTAQVIRSLEAWREAYHDRPLD